MLRQVRFLIAFCIFFVTTYCPMLAGAIYPGPLFPPTKGEVWPKPQQQIKHKSYYTFLPSVFKFQITDETCHILGTATSRYFTVLENLYLIVESRPKRNSRWMFSTFRSQHTNYYQGNIEELRISLSMPCEEYPQYGMDEEYILNVNTYSTLSSKSVWGILRGLETFSQLFYLSDDYKNVYVNQTSIIDSPNYPHRGLLIDTSRHYLKVPTILTLLDGLEANKMNVLHWHIVDDQSFPYESDKFPQLSIQGAYDPTMVYTKSDVIRIVNYARDRGIRVIPEFDVPGHTRSWGQAYPNILTKCYHKGRFVELGPMDPTNNMTYKLFAELFEEVSQRFPDSYFHVGGDEVQMDCWMSNPQIVNFMNKNNMTQPSELHAYFMKRILKIIGTKATSIVWQEVFDEKAAGDKDTIIQIWKSLNPGKIIEILSAGYKVIYSSAWYLDHLASGGDWTEFYKVDPRKLLPDVAFNIHKENIIGGEACMWGEVVDDNNIVARVFPRTSAVAEKLWSNTDVPRYLKFYNTFPLDVYHRLEEQTCRMTRRKIPAQPPSGAGFCITT